MPRTPPTESYTPVRPVLLAPARLALAVLLAAACSGEPETDGASTLPPSMLPAAQGRTNADLAAPQVPFDPATPVVVARAVARFPHDTGAYTQGLVVAGGRMLEGTGRYGQSEVRELAIATGTIVRRTALPSSAFGEGIAMLGSRLFQLTWTGGRGYIYDAATLARRDSFSFAGEGWGLTSNGSVLLQSDGSARIRILDPHSFAVTGTITVSEGGKEVWDLNELEWVHGELWANIYQTDFIARIDPRNGAVIGWVDTSKLLTASERADVARRGGTANGIAYDAQNGKVFLTGKLWPWLVQADVGVIR